MKSIKRRYNILNIVIILLAAAFFVYDFTDIRTVFQGVGVAHMLILIVTVLLVHAIKAGRLYLALYGADISPAEYIKVYCKVTPVSVIVPFKLGEFFRMYCYGKTIGSALKSIVIVVLDRFMDTAALVVMILLVWLFNGGQITALVYVLLLFLLVAIMLYCVFPGMYIFWKKYILHAKATENKLTLLKLLEKMNRIYEEIKNVTKGRGIILFFLSLLAWAIEIGSVALQVGLLKSGDLSAIVSDYLSAAMGIGKCVELRQFVCISVVIMVAMYIITKLAELHPGKREHK